MTRELTRAELEELYLPPRDFVLVDVPRMKVFQVDGEGDPQEEAGLNVIRWLFAAVQPLKLVARERLGRAYVEAPLEALFHDDPCDLVAGRKDRLRWTMMIPGPSWATKAMFAQGVAAAAERLGDPPPSLRLGQLAEGRCVQFLHVGPPAKCRPMLERLHREFLPAHGLAPNGPHHEIYLNDPRRTTPARIRTVFRQPVRALARRRTQADAGRARR